MTAPDLGFVGLLLHVEEPEVLQAFVRAQLGAVRDYDDQRGSALISTLRALVAHDLDRSEAALTMQVHVNTVQQRIRRIEALTGRDFQDPRFILDATAALAVLSVLEPV